MGKLKLISDDVIRVEQPEGRGYVRLPVASMDFDVEKINAFIDAFSDRLLRQVTRAVPRQPNLASTMWGKRLAIVSSAMPIFPSGIGGIQ